jgi:glutamate-1-semialdehyde 2,1-aminomutase
MIIEETYRQRHAQSAARYAQALEVFPSGVTHDGRYMAPFPLYIDHSQGAHKWDVDDNRLIDYWTGHGALLLGHAHPAIVAPRSPSRWRAAPTWAPSTTWRFAGPR